MKKVCGICGDADGRFPLKSCGCTFDVCEFCVRNDLAATKDTYHGYGPLCPQCRKESYTLYGIQEAEEMETILVNEAVQHHTAETSPKINNEMHAKELEDLYSDESISDYEKTLYMLAYTKYKNIHKTDAGHDLYWRKPGEWIPWVSLYLARLHIKFKTYSNEPTFQALPKKDMKKVVKERQLAELPLGPLEKIYFQYEAADTAPAIESEVTAVSSEASIPTHFEDDDVEDGRMTTRPRPERTSRVTVRSRRKRTSSLDIPSSILDLHSGPKPPEALNSATMMESSNSIGSSRSRSNVGVMLNSTDPSVMGKSSVVPTRSHVGAASREAWMAPTVLGSIPDDVSEDKTGYKIPRRKRPSSPELQVGSEAEPKESVTRNPQSVPRSTKSLPHRLRGPSVRRSVVQRSSLLAQPIISRMSPLSADVTAQAPPPSPRTAAVPHLAAPLLSMKDVSAPINRTSVEENAGELDVDQETATSVTADESAYLVSPDDGVISVTVGALAHLGSSEDDDGVDRTAKRPRTEHAQTMFGDQRQSSPVRSDSSVTASVQGITAPTALLVNHTDVALVTASTDTSEGVPSAWNYSQHVFERMDFIADCVRENELKISSRREKYDSTKISFESKLAHFFGDGFIQKIEDDPVWSQAGSPIFSETYINHRVPAVANLAKIALEIFLLTEEKTRIDDELRVFMEDKRHVKLLPAELYRYKKETEQDIESRCKSESEAIREEVQHLRTKDAEWNVKLEKSLNEIKRVRASNVQLKAKLGESHKNLANLRKRNAQLNAKVNEMRTKIVGLCDRDSQSKAKLEESHTDISNIREREAQLICKVNGMLREIESLRESDFQSKAKLDESRNTIANLCDRDLKSKANLEELCKEIENLRDKDFQSNAKVKDLCNEITNLHDKISKSRASLEESLATIADLNEKYSKSEATVEDLQRDVTDLSNRDLQSKLKLLIHLDREQELRKEIIDLHDKDSLSKSMLESLRNEIMDLRASACSASNNVLFYSKRDEKDTSPISNTVIAMPNPLNQRPPDIISVTRDNTGRCSDDVDQHKESTSASDGNRDSEGAQSHLSEFASIQDTPQSYELVDVKSCRTDDVLYDNNGDIIMDLQYTLFAVSDHEVGCNRVSDPGCETAEHCDSDAVPGRKTPTETTPTPLLHKKCFIFSNITSTKWNNHTQHLSYSGCGIYNYAIGRYPLSTTGISMWRVTVKTISLDDPLFIGIIDSRTPLRSRSQTHPTSFGWSSSGLRWVCGEPNRGLCGFPGFVQGDSLVLTHSPSARQISLDKARDRYTIDIGTLSGAYIHFNFLMSSELLIEEISSSCP